MRPLEAPAYGDISLHEMRRQTQEIVQLSLVDKTCRREALPLQAVPAHVAEGWIERDLERAQTSAPSQEGSGSTVEEGGIARHALEVSTENFGSVWRSGWGVWQYTSMVCQVSRCCGHTQVSDQRGHI